MGTVYLCMLRSIFLLNVVDFSIYPVSERTPPQAALDLLSEGRFVIVLFVYQDASSSIKPDGRKGLYDVQMALMALRTGPSLNRSWRIALFIHNHGL